MIFLNEVVDCDIEILDNKAVCVLYLMNQIREPKRVQVSVSNLTKFLNYMGCQRLKQIIGQVIKCKVNDYFKITHVSRMHLDMEEWIVAKEVTNDA